MNLILAAVTSKNLHNYIGSALHSFRATDRKMPESNTGLRNRPFIHSFSHSFNLYTFDVSSQSRSRPSPGWKQQTKGHSFQRPSARSICV